MNRKIEFISEGLNILQLNTMISALKEIKFDSIEKNKSIKQGYKGGFSDTYNYYYIIADSILITNGEMVKDIFFAVDKRKKVRGIFLVIEYISDSLVSDMDKVFGTALLQSYSSVANVATNTKRFWRKNDVTVFLTQYPDTAYAEIAISNNHADEPSPGIYIKTLYK